jgi:hypothetical protein
MYAPDGPHDAAPVSAPTEEPAEPAAQLMSDAPISAAEPRLAGRIAILGGMALVGVLAVGMAIAVLVRLNDTNEHPANQQAGPLAIDTDRPLLSEPIPRDLPVAIPPAPSDSPEPEPAQDLQIDVLAATAARATFEGAQKPPGTHYPSAARAEKLVAEAQGAQARGEPKKAAALYREASAEFTSAWQDAAVDMGYRAVVEARPWAERWDAVPAEGRGRWSKVVDEAKARLDAGTRMIAEGDAEEGRAEALAAGAALESTWVEHLAEAIIDAGRDATAVWAAWESEFAPMARLGMTEPAEVSRARAWVDEPDAHRATSEETLLEIRGAASVLSAATEVLHEQREAFEQARAAAEHARESFERTLKPDGVELPPSRRAERFLAQAPGALSSQGVPGAIALYGRAREGFEEATALAGVVMAEHEAAQRRATALSALAAVRTEIDAAEAARSNVAAREARAITRVDQLRARATSTDPAPAAEARKQLPGAEKDSHRASRAVTALQAAGLSAGGIETLRDAVRQAQVIVDSGAPTPAALLDDTLGRAQRLIEISRLVDGAVAAEASAREARERWQTVVPADVERWKARLNESSAQLEAGTLVLGRGEIAEAAKQFKTAEAAFGRLWDEFTAESLGEARRAVAAALADWESLFAETPVAGRTEPDEVKQARAAIDAARSAAAPEKELEALSNAGSLLAGAIAGLREKRAVINETTSEGLSPLLAAVKEGNPAMVEALLKQGADVNVVSDEGLSPLALAVVLGRAEIAKVLLDAGADRSTTGPDGHPLLFLSVSSPATLQLFLDEAGRTTHRGRTLLHEIAASGVERKVNAADQVTMATMVLERFPELLGQRDALGLTALDIARQRSAGPLTWFLTQWRPKQ